MSKQQVILTSYPFYGVSTPVKVQLAFVGAVITVEYLHGPYGEFTQGFYFAGLATYAECLKNHSEIAHDWFTERLYPGVLSEPIGGDWMKIPIPKESCEVIHGAIQ